MPELRVGSAEAVGMLPERIELARNRAAEWVKSGHTPSLVILVARRGVIVLHEAFGKLVPEDDSPPLERDSIFPVSSVTKPITATLVMSLVEDGLLGLNRPVRDYIPEVCGEGTEEVLVHHLLTHTSGYNDEALDEFGLKRWNEGIEFPHCDSTQHPMIHELLTLFYPAPLWKPPGEEMSYSNQNYRLLGEIVRRITGRSLDDFARERLFSGLGMSDTSFVVPEAARARVVKRPADAPFAPFVNRYVRGIDSDHSLGMPSAEGGACTTAKDLGVFGQMFLNGGTYGGARILSTAAVSEMTRNQIPGIGTQFFGATYHKEASWGFGWQVQSNEKWRYWSGSLLSLGTYQHGGAGGTCLWVDPVNEIVGVYLSVVLEVTEDEEQLWNLDLFQNLVTSAVES
ncbi:MAG: serine hydrolase domain-containing protein [Myxococcota bacterium]